MTNWRDNKDITSFYFTRFGDDITEKDLWYHFKKWGDVREIFIPNQRNYNGRRYGFVRFKEIRDTQYTARQLDKVVIGELKLYVNIPKYGREKPRKEDVGSKSLNQKVKPQTEGIRARQDQTTPVSYLHALTHTNWVLRHRTVPNSLPHSRGPSTSSIHIDIGPEDTNWLEDAWIGRLKNPAIFETLEDEVWWWIGMDLKPKYIGDDQVLLFGLTDEVAKQIMKDGTNGDTPLFYSMERWSPNVKVGSRLTWVHVWGIPLQVWSVKHIQKMLAVMGDMVDLDDDVEDKRRLNRARVLIKIPWRPMIQHT